MTAVNLQAPIALQPFEGEALWFLDFLVIVKASSEATAGRVSIIEHVAPHGAASPLHVHRHDDEWFHVLEGELTFWVGGRVIVAPEGSFVYGPKDIPHTFTVSSAAGARFLLGTEPGGFDDFVRELATPAHAISLPPDDLLPPSPEQLTAVAARYGIEILGPPGIPS